MSSFCLNFPHLLATSWWSISLNSPLSFFLQHMIDLQLSSARSSSRNSQRWSMFLYRCSRLCVGVGVVWEECLTMQHSKLLQSFWPCAVLEWLISAMSFCAPLKDRRIENKSSRHWLTKWLPFRIIIRYLKSLAVHRACGHPNWTYSSLESDDLFTGSGLKMTECWLVEIVGNHFDLIVYLLLIGEAGLILARDWPRKT